MIKQLFLLLVLLIPVSTIYADKDEDYSESEAWNDKDYEEIQKAEEKADDEDSNEDDQRDSCHEKGGKMKGGECFTSDDDRDENDLKDNENEDACYYEGVRVDNDNSFCD